MNNLTIKEIGCVLLAMKPFGRESDQMYLWNRFHRLFVKVIEEKYPDQPEAILFFNSIVED